MTNQNQPQLPHKIKRYSKAPLPFVGQKRFFLKHFEKILTDNITNDGNGWTIIDVFGGSGLLSNNAKALLPKARVIYNDFDNYAKRLANIADSNRLRHLLAPILANEPRHKKINQPTIRKLRQAIDSFDGCIDMRVLSTWLLFAGKHANSIDELFTQTLYNNLRKADFAPADDYLVGIEVVAESFETLLPKFAGFEKTLLILDPPYICTEQGSYANDVYFGMTKFLQLMHHVRPPYLFFSSTRSELLDYMAYVQEYEPTSWQRFGNFELLSFTSTINRNASYEDNLIYRF